MFAKCRFFALDAICTLPTYWHKNKRNVCTSIPQKVQTTPCSSSLHTDWNQLTVAHVNKKKKTFDFFFSSYPPILQISEGPFLRTSLLNYDVIIELTTNYQKIKKSKNRYSMFEFLKEHLFRRNLLVLQKGGERQVGLVYWQRGREYQFIRTCHK